MIFEEQIAKDLLKINAVNLNPNHPYTWASGWKSPIYCDNRKALSFPEVRQTIVNGFANVAKTYFADVTCIAGVATAGIAWGSLLADKLNLPFCYVRPKPKEHGMGNQIEGFIEPNAKILVIEDLISTGKSSLQVCDVLQKHNYWVLGMASIFNYGFDAAASAFAKAGLPLFSLTNYNVLLNIALQQNSINSEQLPLLENWRKSPETWQGV
jgi:orotate phosphoribosyltransferase